tara:strand:- start:84 stop:455 length:372 start_codon:yes stop_codon:yes gene_type:complete
MANKETVEKRKKRFQAMSSNERKALIREKMKAEGLLEGSGVPGKDLSSYDREEIWDLIQLTRCFPEMHTQSTQKEAKLPNKKKAFVALIMIAIALGSGMVFLYEQYPSPEIRRELSVNGIFID